MMEGSGERATGTPNTIYDLSSVLFHALEGGASYDQYVQDAEEAGDEELVDFFRRVRDEDAMRADEAQILLAERTPAAGAEGGVAPSEGLATGAASMTRPIAPDTEPIEDVPARDIEDVPPPREEPIGATSGREPLMEEQERARQAGREQGEDKGLVDRVKDALLTDDDEERRRREETGETRRR